MSLDVTLKSPDTVRRTETCYACGHEHEVTEQEEYYSANITHNLNKMADAAGIYYALWRPDEIGMTTAAEIMPLLENGLELLLSKPEVYRKYDSPNGWGIYDHFVPFVRKYLDACKKYPHSILEISR